MLSPIEYWPNNNQKIGMYVALSFEKLMPTSPDSLRLYVILTKHSPIRQLGQEFWPV